MIMLVMQFFMGGGPCAYRQVSIFPVCPSSTKKLYLGTHLNFFVNSNNINSINLSNNVEGHLLTQRNFNET